MSPVVTNPERNALSPSVTAPDEPESAGTDGPDLNVLEDRVPEWLQAPRVLALWTTEIGRAHV